MKLILFLVLLLHFQIPVPTNHASVERIFAAYRISVIGLSIMTAVVAGERELVIVRWPQRTVCGKSKQQKQRERLSARIRTLK